MATTAQTYGLIPAYHPSGQSRATEYTIASTYTTAIYQGALVKLVTGGGIENGDGSTDAIGVFAGCNYQSVRRPAERRPRRRFGQCFRLHAGGDR